VFDELMKDCFGDTNKGSIFDYKKDESKLYVLLTEYDGYKERVIYNNKKYRVLTFMTLNEMNGIDTLWNVCTPTDNRKKGYLTKMMKNFLLNTTKDVQLFVEDKTLIPMYKKLGFDDKGLNEYGYTTMFHSKYTI